jgi:oxygen-independent coproporphyrinogen-3 oxidase
MSVELADSLCVYLHFPFCRKKCLYCDFYSITNEPELIPAWKKGIITEFDLYFKSHIDRFSLKTLYVGGGSPNLLAAADLQQIVERLHQYLDFSALIEFSIELNPGLKDDLNLEYYSSLGINRLSVGIQSFNDLELKTLGRIHDARQARQAIEQIRRNGQFQLSCDLIFGIPGQTLNSWSDSLARLLCYSPEHISLYCLSYENNTPLTSSLSAGKIKPLSDELNWQMYKFAHQFLESAGYRHYEVSNWSKPGFECRHNLNYWHMGNYLGFGPAAHSFINNHRSWNHSDLREYLSLVDDRILPIANSEHRTAQESLLEFLFLSLRMAKGLNFERFTQLSNLDFNKILSTFKKDLYPDFDSEYGISSNGFFHLNLKGWFVIDYIVLNLFKIIEQEIA